MPVPNPFDDGSYDPGAQPATQDQGTQGMFQIAAQQHPEMLQDPNIMAAMNDPSQLQGALQTWLKKNDPSYDPNNTYKIGDSGQATPNNSSWFSDNLPWITALMGAGIGGAAGLTGLGSGGAEAGADAAGSAATGLGPSTGASMAATEAATAAPEGIAAGGAGAAGAGAAGASALDGVGPSTPANMAATSAAETPPAGIAAPGASSGSLLSTILGKSKGLSNVLGGASKAAQGQSNFNSANAVNWEKLKLAAPGDRLKTALGAALTKNYTPETLNWGGPGSGLKGQIPTYSGGTKAAMSKSLQDPMLQQMIADAEAGKAPDYSQYENPGGSGLDKVLGSASTISALASLFH